MGHAIHKHMHGSSMKSAEKYDAKEAYNKDLTSKARLHYLENNIADHKGMSMLGDLDKDGKMSSYENTRQDAIEENMGTSRKASPANNYDDDSMSRKASPVNNITYGDKSGPTGYIGQEKKDLMKYNPIDDKAGMSRYKKDHKGMSRNKYGGNKGDESMSKGDY